MTEKTPPLAGIVERAKRSIPVLSRSEINDENTDEDRSSGWSCCCRGVAACGYGYLMFAYPKVPPAGDGQDRRVTGAPRARRVPGQSRHWLHRPAIRSVTGRSFPDRSSPGRSAPAARSSTSARPGAVYSKNITPAAIGSWTDGELLRAVTQGVSKDGSPLFPVMPYPHFGSMSEDDMHAVVAYIRTLKAIESPAPPKPKLELSAQLDRAHDPRPQHVQARARRPTTRWRTAST